MKTAKKMPKYITKALKEVGTPKKIRRALWQDMVASGFDPETDTFGIAGRPDVLVEPMAKKLKRARKVH